MTDWPAIVRSTRFVTNVSLSTTRLVSPVVASVPRMSPQPCFMAFPSVRCDEHERDFATFVPAGWTDVAHDRRAAAIPPCTMLRWGAMLLRMGSPTGMRSWLGTAFTRALR